MRIAAVLALVFLVGCASSKTSYETVLNSWLGSPEGALISQWGVPNNVYETGGQKFLTFGGTRGVVYMSGMAIPVSCITTITVANGIVTNWSYKGNC